MPAGDLRYRIGFYQRGAVGAPGSPDTDYGMNGAYPGTATFITAANVEPKLGGEAVLAGRLTGKNFSNITVRQSSETNVVNTDWICKNEETGEVYNIRSVIDPHQGNVKHGMWWEMLCEEGVAT